MIMERCAEDEKTDPKVVGFDSRDVVVLTLPMLGLLSSKAQGRKDF